MRKIMITLTSAIAKTLDGAGEALTARSSVRPSTTPTSMGRAGEDMA